MIEHRSTDDESEQVSTSINNDEVARLPVENVKRNNFTLEPALFLIIFAWSLTTAVFTNQLMYQACKSVFHLNETTCIQLGTKNESEAIEKTESEVQLYVANILLGKQILETIVGAVTCLRYGPWSDLHGRKPILVAVCMGALVQYFIVTMISTLSDKFLINPWWYLTASFPAAITGGGTTLTFVAFSYISDLTEPSKRAYRNGITQAIILISVLLGSISSGYLNDWTNSDVVFGVATLCVFLALVQIVIFLPETVSDHNRQERYNDIVRPKLYKEIVHTLMKERPNYDRAVVWFVLVAVGFASFVTDGTMTVFYLFVRKQFEWTIENYTAYLSANMTFGAIGSIFALVLLKKAFKMNDIILTIFGYLSSMGQALIVATAKTSWQMYVSVLVGGVKNISYVTCRSILTNMGPDSDIGKINALITSTEAVFQLAGAPSFTQLYKATLDTYPGAFNLLSVLVYFIDALLIIIVYAIQAISVASPTYREL
ncbi:probable peptidoglycan muropeptide transporter SLC46 [Culicoides brevitarsis]|uniref:probable peptidoglycan muropeptide transporter SLC46 n=1 Tax=Culicoides brevitarsis TaxID=469753 RepID=UPI00307B7C9D